MFEKYFVIQNNCLFLHHQTNNNNLKLKTMKISVYKIQNLYPTNVNQQENFCDLVNMPSLKDGFIEVLGEFSHYITKSDLKKRSKVFYRTTNFNNKEIIDGLLLFGNNNEKLFAII